MWLVLCSRGDAAAIWAHRGLARRLAPLVLLHPETLVHGCRWDHRIGSAGASTRITLASGLTLEQGQVRGVLNRLVGVTADFFAGSGDAEYAALEMHALLLSWLHSLPIPVINRPHAQGLAGTWRHGSEWVQLAARSGLPTPRYRQASADSRRDLYGETPLFPPGTATDTVLVLGGRTAGAPAPPTIAAGCIRLAELASTPLLGVDFALGESGPWTFAGATPLPDLRLGGEPFLDLLAAGLLGGSEVAA
jgi:hypothetical protein